MASYFQPVGSDRTSKIIALIFYGVIAAVIAFIAFVIYAMIASVFWMAHVQGDIAYAERLNAERAPRTIARIHESLYDAVRLNGIAAAITLPGPEEQTSTCASVANCEMVAADTLEIVGDAQEVEPGVDIRNAASALGFNAREIDHRVRVTTQMRISDMGKPVSDVRELIVRTYSVMPYVTVQDVTGIAAPQ